jgi:hypothetical protein
MKNVVVYTFRFTLKHSKGYMRIIITGSSVQVAKHNIVLAKSCSLSSITKTEVQDCGKFVRVM